MKRLFHALNADIRSMMDRLPEAIESALPLRTSHRRDLPDAIRELSETLTSERGNLGESYWSSPRTMSAYVRYFLPWNIFRLARLLPSLELPSPEELTNGTILDLGSGPLTLPIALWVSRPELRTVPLTITCTDVSPHVLEVGHTIFSKIVGEDCPWTINTMRAPFELALRNHYGKVNFIMAGNVLNELRTKADQALEDRLWEVADTLRDALTPNGRILLVEPGTRLGGKLITLVRRAALENGLMPFAPCTHHEECPMFSRKATGWCHFTFSVHDAPDWLMQVSRDAGFERDSASLSFVLLGEATEAPEANAARVISDAFPIPRRREPVRYACSSDGLTLLYDARPLISGALVTAVWPETPIRDDKSGGIFAGWINDEGETQGLQTKTFNSAQGEHSMNRSFRPHGRPQSDDDRRSTPRGQHYSHRQDRDGQSERGKRFGQNDEQGGRGERPHFAPRDRSERSEGQRSFTPRGDKPFPREGRPAYGERREGGERRPYQRDDRSNRGEGRFERREGSYERREGYQGRSERPRFDRNERNDRFERSERPDNRGQRGGARYESRDNQYDGRSNDRPHGRYDKREQGRSDRAPFQKPPFGSARTYGQKYFAKQEKPDDWGNKNYNWEQQAQRYQHADHMPYEQPIGAGRGPRPASARPARSFDEQRGGFEKRPYQRRDDDGARRPHFSRDGQQEGRRDAQRDDRRPYGERRDFQDRGAHRSGDRFERSDRPRFDRNDRHERSDRPRFDRAGARFERSDRPRFDRNERNDRDGYSPRPRFDRDGQSRREGFGERRDRLDNDRPARTERSDRPQRGFAPYRGKQEGRSAYGEQGSYNKEGRGDYNRPRPFIPKPWSDRSDRTQSPRPAESPKADFSPAPKKDDTGSTNE